MKADQKVREIITVLGKQGSGKTHLTKKNLIPNLPEPVIIADTMAEYSDCGVNFSRCSHFIEYVTKDFPNKSGVYVIQIRSKQEQKNFLKVVSEIQEKCSIIFEEASKFCNPKNLPPEISDLVHYGRHNAQTLIFTARRAAELHRDITSQSTAIISFQQTEPNDIRILKSVFSKAADLPELRYQPTDPANNEYMILGQTSFLDMTESQ